MDSKQARILTLARDKGVVRPRDLKEIGVSRTYLNYLTNRGIMIKAGRGLYSLCDFDVTESHSLVEATQAQSNGVVCLLSALSFHRVGTQLPAQVWLAVPYDARVTKSPPVPTRMIYVRSTKAYHAGIEMHELEGTTVAIYSVAKTVADCFKFRNKIGLDVAMEALREAIRNKLCTRQQISIHARLNRVERVMQPYLESLA